MRIIHSKDGIVYFAQVVREKWQKCKLCGDCLGNKKGVSGKIKKRGEEIRLSSL